MLPYTPLHHLLLRDGAAASRDALVMTSGNLSEEPIATDNDEARAAAGRAGRCLPAARPRRSTSAATIRCVRSLRAAQSLPAAAAPRGYAPVPGPPAVRRAAPPGGRRRAEEHLLPDPRPLRLPQPPHRRPGELRDAALLRGRRRALRAPVPRPAASHRLRPAPRLPGHPLRAAAGRADGLPAGRRAAPPRAHRRLPGRERPVRATAGDRRGLRRHRLRRRTAPSGAASSWWRTTPATSARLPPGLRRRCPAATPAVRKPCAHGAGLAVRTPGIDWDDDLPPVRRTCMRRGAATVLATQLERGSTPRRPPAWAACSTPPPRWSASARASTTKPRPPSSWRRSADPRETGVYPFAVGRATSSIPRRADPLAGRRSARAGLPLRRIGRPLPQQRGRIDGGGHVRRSARGDRRDDGRPERRRLAESARCSSDSVRRLRRKRVRGAAPTGSVPANDGGLALGQAVVARGAGHCWQLRMRNGAVSMGPARD